jgi:hypothetical protein
METKKDIGSSFWFEGVCYIGNETEIKKLFPSKEKFAAFVEEYCVPHPIQSNGINLSRKRR